MLKQSSIFLFLILSSLCIIAKEHKYENIDKKIISISNTDEASIQKLTHYIASNFDTDEEKIRAAFIWVVKNIEYDTKKLRYREKKYISTEDLIKKTFEQKKAVCDGFANLFQRISEKLGIKTYVVSGYTRQNEKVERYSHAWCVTQLDDAWYIMDPTWGSGHLLNRITYVRNVNNEYFLAKPEFAIKSHIPFDPMWQCLNHPLTYDKFNNGFTFKDSTTKYFNYKDSILKFEKSGKTTRLKLAIERIKLNGSANQFVITHLKYLDKEIAFYKHREDTERFNKAIDYYNQSAYLYNEFVIEFNKQSKTSIFDRAGLIQRLESIKSKLDYSSNYLNIFNPDSNLIKSIEDAHKTIIELKAKVKKQQEFLKP